MLLLHYILIAIVEHCTRSMTTIFYCLLPVFSLKNKGLLPGVGIPTFLLWPPLIKVARGRVPLSGIALALSFSVTGRMVE